MNRLTKKKRWGYNIKCNNDFYTIESSSQNKFQKELAIAINMVTNKLGKLEDVEERLGLPLDVWVYLVQNIKLTPKRIFVENTIDTEKERDRTKIVNGGNPNRFIVDVDFSAKTITLQGTVDEWCNKIPFAEYGKTWFLVKRN